MAVQRIADVKYQIKSKTNDKQLHGFVTCVDFDKHNTNFRASDCNGDENQIETKMR